MDVPIPPHPFDLAYGTDTGGLVPPEQLRSRHPRSQTSSAYYAMSPSRFHAALDRWRRSELPHPLTEYSFLDLGCGKGRALLLGSEFPFRQAVGLELHRGLARTARRNVDLWRSAGRACCPTHVLHADATEPRLPTGPCLLYLFHPFGAPAMAHLIGHLRSAVRQRASPTLDILYFNPECAELWLQEPTVRLVWSSAMTMSAEDAAADPIANPDDRCDAYRWFGDKDG